MDERVLLRRTSTFDPVALSARLARRFVRGLLEDAGREVWVEAATLAVTEVVTNAVLHAHTAIDVTAVVTRHQLLVEVLDHNPALPAQRSYAAEATTGRGMDLVSAYTSASGVRPLGASGKVVWFRIRDEVAGPAGAEPAGAEPTGAQPAGGEPCMAPHDDPPGRTLPAEAPVDVLLLSLSPALWLAAREHHDAILREYALHRAAHDDTSTSHEDLVLADQARSAVAGLRQQDLAAVTGAASSSDGAGTSDAPVDAPGAVVMTHLPASIDLVLQVRPALGPAFRRLRTVLDAAEALARTGRMLIRPALPEIIAVRNWVCEQVVSQLAGGVPEAWPGADDDRFTHLMHPSGAVDWDDRIVSDSERGVVAADDANRIIAVSRPLAAALGWAVEDLVGRRVVTLVPHRLREAHIAGFSRHLSTGVAHVLDVALQLPVLRKDGTEVVSDFLIEQASVDSSRSVYVAWIDALPP